MTNTLNNGAAYLPSAGEGPVPAWNGTYTATVVNNHDPLGIGRLQLHVPQVLGNAVSGWAVPLGVYLTVPANGSTVSASFLGGDPGQPAWHGSIDLATGINVGATTVVYSVGEPPDPSEGEIWYPQIFSDGSVATGTPQVWTFDSGTDTFSWVTQPSLGAPGLQDGIIKEGIVDATTIEGATLLLYNGTPGSGTLMLSISPTGTVDGFGNTVQQGFVLNGTGGSFISMQDASGVATLTLAPQGATHTTTNPYLLTATDNAGAANENLFTVLSSGKSNSNADAAIQFFSEAANASTPATLGFEFGGTQAATITPAGIQTFEAFIAKGIGSTPAFTSGSATIYATGSGGMNVVDGLDGSVYGTQRRTLVQSGSATISSSSSFATVFSSPVGAGRDYRIHAQFICQANQNGGGMFWIWTWPGTPAGNFSYTVTEGLNIWSLPVLTANTAQSTGPLVFVNGDDYIVTIDGAVVSAAAGTFSIQAALTTSGDTFTILPGAYVDIMVV